VYTQTYSCTNTVAVDRLDLICTQIQVLMDRLSGWNITDRGCLLQAVRGHHVKAISFSVEDEKTVYIRVRIDIDWNEHSLFVAQEGRTVLIKRRYLDSLPEVEQIADAVLSVSNKHDINISTVIWPSDPMIKDVMPFLVDVEVDDYKPDLITGSTIRELKEIKVSAGSGRKIKTSNR